MERPREPETLAARMAAVARDLEGGLDPRRTMEAAVEVAHRTIPAADEVGLSIARRRGRIETPAHTSELVVRADQLQNDLREGPCLDAVWEERVVHSPDLLADRRWPRWAAQASDELGLRSMLCLRLFTHEDTVGGLNLYARSPRAFDARDLEVGETLVAHVAVAVAAAQRIEQLTTAVDTRTTTGQAVGILMERFDLDPDRAFAVLVRVSSHTNRKLTDVADELVRTRRLPGSPEA